jgi:8-oxo-dGTP diphosphatase
MHKIFGVQTKAEYFTRKGAYLIPIKDGKVAVVETPKGLFLLGGGLEPGEDEQESIVRECLEEVGCNAVVTEFACSAEAYVVHNRRGFFHPVQSYYLGELSAPVCNPIEKDHTLLWIDYLELRGRMATQMQNWAIDYCWQKVNSK